MNTATNIIEKNKLHRIDASAWQQSERKSFKFLYIGNDTSVSKLLSNHFPSGIVADGFVQAQQAINRLQLNHIILDAIFVDIPFSETEFEKFYSFLNQKNHSTAAIIYNKKQVTVSQAQTLKELEFVDDISDIASPSINFISKIAFLKKTKSLQVKTYQKSRSIKFFWLKRVFDITVASLAILALLPVFILIAIAVKLESKGPIFYAALRAGKGYKVFKFYKFRSMVVDADKKMEALAHLNQYDVNDSGPKFFKINNDPRITRTGKILRNTSLDELPQLFNVLKGDMSLVGNRPLPLYEAATLTTNDFVERFEAPAGITGLWQIKKRGKAEMSIEERIGLDIHYARKTNPLFDLYIILKTPIALFQKSDV